MAFPALRKLLRFPSRPSRGGRGRTRPPSQPRHTLELEALEERCLLAVFTVTTIADAGPGSLRQAILDANANPGRDTIAFDIDGGVQTIRPRSQLPDITDPVIVDGTTQPGFAGQPVIALNGAGAGFSYGLELSAGGCTVRGLVIQGFFYAGIELSGRGGNLITGNYLGTDVSGTQAAANGAGIGIGSDNNTIGGTDPGSGNLIAGNIGVGISIGSNNNIVQGNYIGTDVTGTRALANSTGILLAGGFPFGPLAMGNLIGGTAAGARNLISGNQYSGITITSANEIAAALAPAGRNTIQGNYIGTDVTGTQALGNGTGILISPGRSAVGNTLIGGTDPGAGNVISGNRGSGVVIQRSANNVLQGNYVGTDSTGMHALGNQAYGVDFSQASNNLVGGTSAAARNLISGNGIAGVHLTDNTARVEGNWIGTDSTGNAPLGNRIGIRVDGTENIVGGTEAGAGNLISGNNYGIFLASNSNRVQGNFIGANAAGTAAVPNGSGVYVVDRSNNLIGGVEPGAGNLISGNFTGITIFSSEGNLVQGNQIGTDLSGNHAVGNGDGVDLSGPDNLVGGTATGAGNLIAGNLQSGVRIASSGNTVQGNTIGTTITGLGSLGNENGVYIGVGANQNTVGGTDAGAGNLISGNRTAGIFVSGDGNVVQGNSIGTDLSGTRAVANFTGVRIDSGSDNLIGGTAAEARNVISGNISPSLEGNGILISMGQRNIVEGNFIGTDRSGSRALGNRNGIHIVGGQENQVGGTQPDAGNLLSGNLVDNFQGIFGAGVLISQSDRNVIQGNTIGTDLSGSQALANSQGISVSGSDNLVGGTAAGAGNLISGNMGQGISIGSNNNVVQGNFIGTDVTGTRALGNGDGVNLNALGGSNNLIGGTEPGARNLISGNHIGIVGGTATIVQGNYIGTDVTGRFALGNDTGIYLGGARHCLIGGTSPGAGNVISGSRGSGVNINTASDSVVQGNRIGTDATSTYALPNANGVEIDTIFSNLIGGTEPGAGNLISGNTEAGIYFNTFALDFSQLVQGNYIGTDISGSRALPNGTGVLIYSGTFGSHITIGGTTAGAGNLISGNTNDGIVISVFTAMGASTGHIVQGNLIGVDVTGTHPLGNGGNGVVGAGWNDLIGGTASGAGNTIAFNGQDGIRVIRGTGNAIRQNAIFSNGGLGIELLSGGNRMEAAPVLTSATSSGGITAIKGTLTSTPTTTFTIELFANTECDPSGFGEGERFLASLPVATDAAGNASFTLILALPIDVGQFVTATATDPGGNTSQFSNCAPVTGPNSPGSAPGGSGRSDYQAADSMIAHLLRVERNGLRSSALAFDPVNGEGRKAALDMPLPSQAGIEQFFAAQPFHVRPCRPAPGRTATDDGCVLPWVF